MCTMIVEKVEVSGSGKGHQGWFALKQANVTYDHPYHAPLDHSLNISFVNEDRGLSARVPWNSRRSRRWPWSPP